MQCPLCNASGSSFYFEDKARSYLKCGNCQLVYVPDRFHLDPVAEKRVYDQHQNNPTDPDYREFLSRLFKPMVERVSVPATGLDFGAGPGPTLSVMFEEAGYQMEIYDRFYADNPRVLDATYDFISCSEVVEHLRRPGIVLPALIANLKPTGWLGIMTKRVQNRQAFAAWHYKNDPTHVCFYSKETFEWLCGRYGCEPEFIGDDVILMRKLTIC